MISDIFHSLTLEKLNLWREEVRTRANLICSGLIPQEAEEIIAPLWREIALWQKEPIERINLTKKRSLKEQINSSDLCRKSRMKIFFTTTSE
nr:MAG TPA: hypothetical protein [Caudoviricetes sp.]